MSLLSGNSKYRGKGAGSKDLTTGGVLLLIDSAGVQITKIFGDLEDLPLTVMLLGFIAAIVGVVLIIRGTLKRNKAIKKNMDEVILPLLDKEFPGAIYDPKGKDAESDIYISMRLVPKDSIIRCSDCLSAEFDGSYFEYLFIHTYHNYKNKTVTRYKGNVFSYNGDRNIHGSVRIVTTYKGMLGKEEHNFAGRDKHNEVKIETGDEAFDDTFDVYASDIHTGHYLMNAHVKEKIVQFREKYEAFCIMAQGMDVYITIPAAESLLLPIVECDQIEQEELAADFKEGICIILNDLKELQHVLSLHVGGETQ